MNGGGYLESHPIANTVIVSKSGHGVQLIQLSHREVGTVVKTCVYYIRGVPVHRGSELTNDSRFEVCAMIRSKGVGGSAEGALKGEK
jgi:hypothetical protein